VATQLNTFILPEAYLEVERESETKSEYYDGVVYAMTGASINHIRVVTNLTRELSSQLRARRCDVLSNEMKVRLQNSRKFFYPDVIVLCGEPEFHDERRDIILNPLLVIEVLSDSTEAFDRGTKFQAYQTLDSLKEYILVAQDRPVVEQYVRQADGKWIYTAAVGLESSLTLPSVECSLNLSAVYDKVDFDS
jgi:Uma2 family endonuclease